MLGLVSTMALSCSKKKNDDSDSSKPAPKLEVVEQQPQYGEGYAIIKAGANHDDATFMCQVVATNLQTMTRDRGDWQECDPKTEGFRIDMQAGMSYYVRVKAVKGNSESEIIEIDLNGQDGGGATISAEDLAATILNKGEVSSTYQSETLVLNLGVTGNMATELSQIQFECQRENENTFRACPQGQTYDFGDLVSGQSYSLAIRAVLPDGRATVEDYISFQVKLPVLMINGEQQLNASLKSSTQNPATDRVQLNVGGDIDGYQVSCKIDDQDVDCNTEIDLGNPQEQGGHTLTVEIKDQTGAQIQTRSIQYCTLYCGGIEGFSGPNMTGQTIAAGVYWEFDMPVNFHMTEWSQTFNTGSAVNYYQVLPESDPFYMGNDLCDKVRPNNAFLPGEAPMTMSFESQVGTQNSTDIYSYCKRRLLEPELHFLTEDRIAVNHVEIATNENAMGCPGCGGSHERVSINEFSDRFHVGDFRSEFRFTRSKFHEICMHSTLVVETPVKIDAASKFWDGDDYTAYYMTCYANLSDGSPANPWGSSPWQVGAFFVTREPLPWGCFNRNYHQQNQQTCSAYSNKSVLEVVYMSNNEASPHNFLREMQRRVVKDMNLRERTPL
jgi:hypothetical protein